MRQKQNEILGWIHPELFNPKWLIPYKARADPSSVLINTLSLFLNRKTGGGKGMGEEEKENFPLFSPRAFVSEAVLHILQQGFYWLVETNWCFFFSPPLPPVTFNPDTAHLIYV